MIDLRAALACMALFLASCLAPVRTPFTPEVVAYTTTPVRVTTTSTATVLATPESQDYAGGESVSTPTTDPGLPPTPAILVPIQPSPSDAQPASGALPPTPVPVQVVPTAPLEPTEPPPLAPVSDVAGAEQAIIDLTNAQRSRHGLASLARDETIMSIARQRVQDMAARDYFSHYDPVTGVHLAREAILAAGYSRAGENIYWSGAVDLPDFPARAINWFMSDPPHAAGILSASYTRIGVGVAWNGTGWVVVQDFAAP